MKNRKMILMILTALVLVQAVAADFISLGFVSQDPDPVFTGSTVDVRVSVSNSAKSAVENRVVEVVADYPFEQIPGESLVKDVGVLKSYQSGDDIKVMKFKLKVSKDAIQGTYDLNVIEYEKNMRDTHSIKTISIDVKSKESAEIIHIDKVELLPGQVTPVTFTINNVGSAPLRDLTFTWENEDGVILPVGSDDTKHIKYLDVGKSVELLYNVIASSSASPDLYKLKLTLTYDDPITNASKDVTSAAGVYVGGRTDFDVAYSGSSNGETSFSISNIGSVPASSVTVSIPKQNSWRVTGSDSVIIGNLDSGDYTIASFSLQSAGNLTRMAGQYGANAMSPNGAPAGADNARSNYANGAMPENDADGMPGAMTGSNRDLQIMIAYTDTRGERQQVIKSLVINPSVMGSATAGTTPGAFAGRRPVQTTSTNYTNYLIVLLVLVLAYVGWKRYKSGKYPFHKKK